VARVAKMSVSPTKPLCSTTTILAFELNEIFSVFWAVLNRNVTTARANQLFCFEPIDVLLIHCFGTVLSSSKIRRFTFKTHEIGVYSH
jgi:hypothetical protein